MTAAEAHQQELEHQEWKEKFDEIESEIRRNHGKFAGVAITLRNATGQKDVDQALELLEKLLVEFESLERRLYEHVRFA